MDQDIRALCYALAYNSVIFVGSALLWIFVVRRVRKDCFKPNARRRQKVSSLMNSPPWRASTLRMESSVLMSFESQAPILGFIPRDHWIVLLFNWDIARFNSTDVYLYLLFLKGAAILFFIITVISIGVVLPIFWTARSTTNQTSRAAALRELDFFERAVITNVRGDDVWRIWVIYVICWIITIVGLVASFKFYQSVRSDEFRAALFTSKRRTRDTSNAPARFMPNKYSVVLVGLDRTLLDAGVVRRKLLRFFEESEILAVHIVMDFHEALTAHRVFQDCLSQLLDAQKREEDRRAKEEATPKTAEEEVNSSYWAITLPSADEPNPSPSTTRNNKEIHTSQSQPDPLNPDNMSLPRTSATETSKKPGVSVRSGAAWSSTASESNIPSSTAYHEMHRLATSPKSSSFFISSSSRFQPSIHPVEQRLHLSEDEEVDVDEEYSSAASSVEDTETGNVAGENNFAPRRLRVGEQHPDSAAGGQSVSHWWHTARGGDESSRDLPVRRRSGLEETQSATPSAPMSHCLMNPFHRKDKRTRVQERINHYEAKVLTQFSILNRIRSQPPTRNVGMAFISFRHAEAARFAISHDFGDPACPMFRSRNVNADPVSPECAVCGRDTTEHDCGCTKWNRHWRIREAPPPNDIVWENIHISSWIRWFRRVSANILIFLISLLLTSSALVADALNPFAQHVEHVIEKVNFFRMSISGWLAPLILYLINALLLPFLVAWAAGVSKFWRNSSRERAVLHGNINFMVLNSLVFPVIGTTSIQGAILFLFHNSDVANLFTILGQMVAGASGSFMTRYVLNAVFINSAMQLLQIPMFSQQRVMLKLGKKPRKWAFDFGYWYAFHLSVLALCLIFSVDLPMIPPLGCLFFTAKYMVDKYNFAFAVWKVTAESAGAVASTVCSFMFSFQSLFLFLMASYFVTIGLHAAALLGSTANSTMLHSSVTLTVTKPSDPTDWGATEPLQEMVTPISLPTQRKAKAIVVGGLVMLSISLLMFLVTFGERAQRSIVDHHAGKLRRIARSCHTWIARKLADWDIVVPSRQVVQTLSSEAELTESQIEELRKAYAHPYEKEDIEVASLAD